MAEPPPFVYDPLPAGYIRLLTPASSETGDGHSWNLQTVDLGQSDLEFDALSYVWGSDSERLRITLNGCAMQVHRNLYTALPYLARRGDGGQVRPIWIDAICINQADREETMVQIREMNRVYKQAKKVWIWLGTTKHQDRIPDALRFLENLRDEKEGQQHRNIDELYGKLSFDTLDAKPALCHLVLNDWFGRLWVLQEAALAREVTFLCGDSKCSWELMENAMKDAVLCQLFDKEFDGVKNPLPLRDEPVRTGMARGLWRISMFCVRTVVQLCWSEDVDNQPGHQIHMLALAMNMSRSLVCLRPEDRVLGLLGLMDPRYLRYTCLDPAIQYFSVEDLFTRAAKFILEMAWKHEHSTLWMWLGWAFALDKRQGLPSWVPDLHRSTPWNNSQADYERKRPSRYAAIRKKLHWRPSVKQEQLVLTGKIHDEVVKVFAMMPFPDSSQHNTRSEQREKLLAIANWEQTVAAGMTDPTLTRPRAGIGSDGIHEEYWRALVDNQEPGRYLDQTIKHDWYLDFQTMGRRLRGVDVNPTTLKAKSDHVCLESGTSTDVSEQFLEAEDQCANAYKFMEAMQKVSFRQLFKTKKGHLSSTIPGVIPGDLLIALNGAPILHVVRKVNAAVDGEPEIWEFVGDAYVYPLDCGTNEESILEEEQADGNHAEGNTRADSNTNEANDEEREFVFV